MGILLSFSWSIVLLLTSTFQAASQQPQKPTLNLKVVEEKICVINRAESKDRRTTLYCGQDEKGEKIIIDMPITVIQFPRGDVFILEILSNGEYRFAPQERQPEGSRYDILPPCHPGYKRDAVQVPSCNPDLKVPSLKPEKGVQND